MPTLTLPSNIIHILPFSQSDIPLIVQSFAKYNWDKPAATFETYWKEQQGEERKIWLAFYEDEFAGYVTLKWQSSYSSFREQGIPEIMDLNVLPSYRGKGVGTALLNCAETEALSRKKSIIGIGVGLYEEYGNSQKLYVARGYTPDGLGITHNYSRIQYGDKVVLDDDLVLWFTKKLN
jgi:GNAT superfamily N-acetyltransferase